MSEVYCLIINQTQIIIYLLYIFFFLYNREISKKIILFENNFMKISLHNIFIT